MCPCTRVVPCAQERDLTIADLLSRLAVMEAGHAFALGAAADALRRANEDRDDLATRLARALADAQTAHTVRGSTHTRGEGVETAPL